MEAIEAIETLKGEVVTKLQVGNIALLTEICVEQNITIPPKKAGIKSALFNLVVMHLSSPVVEDSEDGGKQMLDELKAKLDSKLGVAAEQGRTVKEEGKPLGKSLLTLAKNAQVDTAGTSTETDSNQNAKNTEKVEVKTEQVSSVVENIVGAMNKASNSLAASGAGLGAGAGAALGAGGNITSSQLRGGIRLKEFKIHSGTIGGENQLDLDEVIYQINEARQLGHTIREVVSGVIRATKPGSSLRKYCQTRENLSYESLVSLLRSHYGTEDSQEMLEEMRKMKQEPTEKVVDYARRVMAMRNRILEVNKKEDHDIGEAVVRKACFRTISLGIRRDTIRLEARQLLINIDLDDDSVLQELAQVAALDKKHQAMINGGRTEACQLNTEINQVNQVSVPQQTDNALLADIARSLSTHVGEMEALRKRLDKMEERLNDNKEKDKDPRKGRRVNFSMKCKDCEEKKLFCVHCAKCGKEDHKRKDCPEN